MDGGDGKNKVGHKTRVEDLERVVRVRKYQHCEAEYSQLAKEPNTMPDVRDRRRERGRKPQLGKVPARKSPLTRMKSSVRRADRSVWTFLRFVAVVAALVAVVVYWNFGTFSPCDVLREAIRQRGDLAAIFPDGFIDFAFEAQFGDMSAKRCFVVLLEAVTSPVPTTGQASQLSMQPFALRQGKQRSSPSVPRSAPFAFEHSRHRSHGRGKMHRF
jgi:hypothetical protein